MPSYTEAGRKHVSGTVHVYCIFQTGNKLHISSDYIIWLLHLCIFYNYDTAYTEHLERNTVAGRGSQAHSKSPQPVSGPSPWAQKNTEVQSQVEIWLRLKGNKNLSRTTWGSGPASMDSSKSDPAWPTWSLSMTQWLT